MPSSVPTSGSAAPAAHKRVGKSSRPAGSSPATGPGFRPRGGRPGGVLAFTWVTQAPGTVATDLTGDFGAIPEIEECHHITGEADYLLIIPGPRHPGPRARDPAPVQATRHVFSTESDVVFSTAFERRPLGSRPRSNRGLSASGGARRRVFGRSALQTVWPSGPGARP